MYCIILNIFKYIIVIATILSFYILINNIYYKKSTLINAWRFPILLAILIEEYITVPKLFKFK